jgi:hypothetical protein
MAAYATLLRDRITLTCRCVDRIFLQACVPNLETTGLVARFLLGRGCPYASSAALGKIGDAYVAVIHRFAEVDDIPIAHFKNGESKEELVRPRPPRRTRLLMWGTGAPQHLGELRPPRRRLHQRPAVDGWGRPIAEAVAIFLGVPLVAGYLTRTVGERTKVTRFGSFALSGKRPAAFVCYFWDKQI